MPLKVTLQKLEFADEQQTDLITRACRSLQSALNHPRFKERMATAKYKQTRYEDANRRSTSIQADKVIEFILSGAERGTLADQEIDLELKLANLRAPTRIRVGVVGSTALGKFPIQTAYWFIDECVRTNDVISAARHFIHEWLHVVGFYHYSGNSARDDVPYVVGEIVRTVLKEDMAGTVPAEDQNIAGLLESSLLEDEQQVA